ncbi:heme peroxidase [Hypoxylon trugodes]|uniref:heme peroxidase n=1 Tax=Hypoxylon trugodes TaxID=326681 RepID=UPI00219AF626|nr:heme peroxidase [Hypoxylon trugodes]KAI1386068.1 heme peroxidase [Hypoxylon trugodes]
MYVPYKMRYSLSTHVRKRSSPPTRATMVRTSGPDTMLLLTLAAVASGPVAAYSWPDPKIDLLESILYQQNGYRQYGLAFGVSPCTNMANMQETGRDDSAEWFRTAYHDMATADVQTGIGGIDASIGFETDRPENKGKAFNETLSFILAFQSARSSMADVIALGGLFSVGSCSNGEVIIPFRGGRIDALEAGPTGVPQPEEDLDTHTAAFARQGFNVSEMIGLVACGHSIGGVHGENFPEIVDVVDDINNQASRQDFDETFDNFDNSVAKQFVANTTQNPLAFGHNETTRSDFRIFNADGGELIRKMAESQQFFWDTCTTLLERMINTVPKGVKLTDVIEPIPVRPNNLFITVNPNGTQTISGEVRILEDGVTSANRQVLIHLKSRDGKNISSNPVVATTQNGLQVVGYYKNLPSFTSYTFTTTVPTTVGVSAFDVQLKDGNTDITNTNGGGGFPFQDALITQAESTCVGLEFFSTKSNNTLNISVAVRDDMEFDTVQLWVPKPVNMIGTFSTRFEPTSTELSKTESLNGTGYSIYSGSYWFTVDSVGPMKTFDLFASGPNGVVYNNFTRWADFNVCQ